MRSARITLASALGALLLVWAPPASAIQECVAVDPPSTEEVLPGVFLTWDSSFLCANAPDSDTYEFTVTVTNLGVSTEAVSVEQLGLVRTTPRPRRQAAGGTLDSTTGLPTTIPPGVTAEFTGSGTYRLVQTDEGKKANLHYLADGVGVSSERLFSLGINAHFREPGIAAE